MAGFMSGMGGMDMSSASLFRHENAALARTYWYIIAGVFGLCLLLRSWDALETSSRRKCSRRQSVTHPTRPRNCLAQCCATMIALAREITYPALYFKNPTLAWLSPPSLGRVLVLVAYWTTILALLLPGAIVHDAYYWERIGFRAAWISVTQIPLVYLLASKQNILGLLAGVSYERFNWLHRWVSRTLLLTVTIHGVFFLREWILADFVAFELFLMPMVKYGIGAWAVLVWTFVSSLKPFRQLSYEIFILQHLIAAVVLLWLLHIHVPKYAQYYVWSAAAALSLDFALKFAQSLHRNVSFRHPCKEESTWARIGFAADVDTKTGDYTTLTIKNVLFSWTPGQHVYLWLPRLGPFEAHPYTIANVRSPQKGDLNNVQFVIRAHKGFSRRLQRHAARYQTSRNSLRAFIQGPFGHFPAWDTFETLVLISASSGASFTSPILHYVLGLPGRSCVERIAVLFIGRKEQELEWYLERIGDTFDVALRRGIELQIRLAVTDLAASGAAETYSTSAKIANPHCFQPLLPCTCLEKDVESSSSGSSISSNTECECRLGSVVVTRGRPDISAVIRGPVEASGGETAVAVCGGKELVAAVSNCVAALSDERAVHKGTGAQGIRLHAETFEL